MAANSLLRSKSYLGAQYRRLRTGLGAPKAITALAYKLARLVYRMLKYGEQFVDKGIEYYEHRYQNQQIQLLRKRAASLGIAAHANSEYLEDVSGEGKNISPSTGSAEQ